jgi:hypothetical protein
MLDTVKKTFGRTSLATMPVPSAPATEAKLKGCQLARGRTRSRVESPTAELEAARLALAQAERTAGDQLIEEMDTTAATETMRAATDRVRILEAALASARQKDEAAQTDLKQAEHQVAIDAVSAACAVGLALGPRWEAIFAAVRQLAIDTARAGDGLCVVGGNEKYAYPVHEITMQASLFMGLAMHLLTNRGHVPTPFMKYKSLTECLEAVFGRPQP